MTLPCSGRLPKHTCMLVVWFTLSQPALHEAVPRVLPCSFPSAETMQSRTSGCQCTEPQCQPWVWNGRPRWWFGCQQAALPFQCSHCLSACCQVVQTACRWGRTALLKQMGFSVMLLVLLSHRRGARHSDEKALGYFYACIISYFYNTSFFLPTKKYFLLNRNTSDSLMHCKTPSRY